MNFPTTAHFRAACRVIRYLPDKGLMFPRNSDTQIRGYIYIYMQIGMDVMIQEDPQLASFYSLAIPLYLGEQRGNRPSHGHLQKLNIEHYLLPYVNYNGSCIS